MKEHDKEEKYKRDRARLRQIEEELRIKKQEELTTLGKDISSGADKGKIGALLTDSA